MRFLTDSDDGGAIATCLSDEGGGGQRPAAEAFRGATAKGSTSSSRSHSDEFGAIAIATCLSDEQGGGKHPAAATAITGVLQ